MAGMKGAYRKGVKRYRQSKRYKKKIQKDYVSKVRFKGLRRMAGYDAYANLPNQLIKRGKERRKRWAKTIIKRFPKFFISTGRKKYVIDKPLGYCQYSLPQSFCFLNAYLFRKVEETVGTLSFTYFLSSEKDIRFRLMQINDGLDFQLYIQRNGIGQLNKATFTREADDRRNFLASNQGNAQESTAENTAKMIAETKKWSLQTTHWLKVARQVGFDLTILLLPFRCVKGIEFTDELNQAYKQHAVQFITAETPEDKLKVVQLYWTKMNFQMSSEIRVTLSNQILRRAKAQYLAYLHMGQRLVQDGLAFHPKSSMKLAQLSDTQIMALSDYIARGLETLGFADLTKKQKKIDRNQIVPEAEQDPFLNSTGSLKNASLNRLILIQLLETHTMRRITNSADKAFSQYLTTPDGRIWQIDSGIKYDTQQYAQVERLNDLTSLQSAEAYASNLLLSDGTALFSLPGGLEQYSIDTNWSDFSSGLATSFLVTSDFTPQTIMQQSVQFAASQNWYQRNGYSLQDQKLSLRVKPATFHHQDPWIEEDGNGSSRILNFTASSQMADNSTLQREFTNSLGDIIGTKFVSSSSKDKFRVAFSILQAQAYVSTTYIIDYDEKEISKLGLRNRAKGKKLPDHIIHLHPDSAWFSFMQLQAVTGAMESLFFSLKPEGTSLNEWANQIVGSITKSQAAGPRALDDYQVTDTNFSQRFYESLSKSFKPNTMINIPPPGQPVYTTGNDDSQAFIYHVIYSCLKSARITVKMQSREAAVTTVEQQMFMVWKYFETMMKLMSKEQSKIVQIQLNIPTYRIKYLEFVRKLTVTHAQISLPNQSKILQQNHGCHLKDNIALLLSKFQTQEENGYNAFCPQFTVTASSTFRRKHILPGIHLLNFLQRGKSKSVIKGRILSNYAAFGQLTPSSGPSGLVGDSLSLMTGKFTSNTALKEAFDLYQDSAKGLQASWRTMKAPLMNLLNKNQTKMMHTFFQMSNTQVAANSPWGLSCIKLRTFMESLETSGFDTLNQEYQQNIQMINGQMNPIGFLPESFHTAITHQLDDIPWEKTSDSVSWTTDQYTPHIAQLVTRKRINSPADAKSQLQALSMQYRFKNLCVQEVNRKWDVDMEFMNGLLTYIEQGSFDDLDFANPRGDIPKSMVLTVQLAILAWSEYLLPKKGKMQLIRDSVTTRQQSMLHLLFCDYSIVSSSEITNTRILDDLLKNISTTPQTWMKDYEQTVPDVDSQKDWIAMIKDNIGAFKMFMRITDPIAVDRSVAKVYIKNDPTVEHHYKSFAQAAVCMSSFRQMINSLVKQKKYDSSSPYWVDCFLGTLLTHGLDSDVSTGQKLSFADLIEADKSSSYDHYGRRKFFNANDQVFQLQSYFATEVILGQEFQSGMADYACSAKVAQQLDAMYKRVAVLSHGTSKYAMGNDYEVDTVSKSVIEHLESSGLTTHFQRRDDYVKVLQINLDGNPQVREMWGIPVDTSGVLYNQDPELYQLPLAFFKNHLQKIKVSMDYSIKNQQLNQRSDPKQRMESFRFYVATTTTPIKALVEGVLDYHANQRSSEFSRLLDDSQLLQMRKRLSEVERGTIGLTVPITVIERILFECAVNSPQGNFRWDVFVQKCFRAFQLLYRVYGLILNMYVQCAYEKLSDYDIYMLLMYIRNYLKKFGADVYKIMILLNSDAIKTAGVSSEIQTGFTMDLQKQWLLLQSTAVAQNYRPAFDLFCSLAGLQSDFVNRGMENDKFNGLTSGIFPLWAEIPPARTASQRLIRTTNFVKDELARFGKTVSRRTAKAIYQLQRDPFSKTRYDDALLRNEYARGKSAVRTIPDDEYARRLANLDNDIYEQYSQFKELLQSYQRAAENHSIDIQMEGAEEEVKQAQPNRVANTFSAPVERMFADTSLPPPQRQQVQRAEQMLQVPLVNSRIFDNPVLDDFSLDFGEDAQMADQSNNATRVVANRNTDRSIGAGQGRNNQNQRANQTMSQRRTQRFN